MQKKDEAYHFALSLVDQLKRLTLYQLAMVKPKFHGILIEAEFSMPRVPPLPACIPIPHQVVTWTNNLEIVINVLQTICLLRKTVCCINI